MVAIIIIQTNNAAFTDQIVINIFVPNFLVIEGARRGEFVCVLFSPINP